MPLDKGTLAMVAAVDLSYLNEKMQKMIQQVAEAEGKKLKPEAGSGTAEDGKGDYKRGGRKCSGRKRTEEAAERVCETTGGIV